MMMAAVMITCQIDLFDNSWCDTHTHVSHPTLLTAPLATL